MRREACILCGSRNLERLAESLRHGPGTVLYCSPCRLGMLEKPPADLRAFFDSEYRGRHGPVPGRKTRYAEMFRTYAALQGRRLDLLRPYLRPNLRVLDVGCSMGHLLSHIKPHVREVVGVDYDTRAVRFARRVLRSDVYACGLHQAGLERGSFGLVFCVNTLEHADDPIAFVS